MQRFFCAQLGNMKIFWFWDDDWLGHGRRCGVVPSSRCIVHRFGGFSAVGLVWRLYVATLPNLRVAEILSLQELFANRCVSEAAHDMWVWSGPCFTTRAAYQPLLDQKDLEDPLFLLRCRLLLKCCLPLKIKVFD